MKRRNSLMTVASFLPAWTWLSACAGTKRDLSMIDLSDIGMLVEYELAPDARIKLGVACLSDVGRRLFGPTELNEKNGGMFQLNGVSIPQGVHITWRDGVDEAHGLYWTTGTIAGDYTVPVLVRIPREVFDRVRGAPGRSLRLRFRIKDGGVDFGWAIQQTGKTTNYDIQRGGDFFDSDSIG